ncbi:MAG TPA: sigma-70 family RNA polymerase sigma factor, partial [Solirubrobacteraceae bacterium]|nr:sigma-70 family RNA polymerase sigma factor [Solirubrobacteraceae bacterium]
MSRLLGSSRATETPERELVGRAQAGDLAAFEELVGMHADRLYTVVLRLVGDRGEAEDVVQETLLRAWRGIGRFQRRAMIFTWLYRIAVNTAISYKRKRKLVLRLQPTGDGTGIDPLDPNETNRPGHAIEMAEQEKRVHEGLARLSS